MMNKLKLLLTLLLVAVGVSNAMAQSYNFTIAGAPSDGQFALGTKWYTIHDGHPNSENSGPHYLGTSSGYLDSKGLQLGTGTKAKPSGEDGYWCVVGDETNGYRFFNRDKGAGQVIGILKSRTAEVTVANMYATDDATVDTYWDITRSYLAAVGGVNYWCVKVHGTTNNYWTDGGNGNKNGYRHLTLWYSDQAVYGWNQNASNGTGDQGSGFFFEEAATEMELNFVNGETSVGTVRVAVPTATTIQTVATQKLPSGYELTGTCPTKTDGTYRYDIPVSSAVIVSDITVNYVDYITKTSVGTQSVGAHSVGTTIASLATTPPSGYKILPNNTALVEDGTASYDVSVVRDYAAASGNINRNADYWTSFITLQVGNQTQKLDGLQSGRNTPVYFDLRGTSKYFTCAAGQLITAGFDKSRMNAMQGYCFVDENYDGTFSNTVNSTDHCADPSSDLKAWGGYQFGGSTWYNSEGQTPAADNDNESTRLTMPAFTAPTTPGTYCMRMKIDWNNIDPAGHANIKSNAGIIVDVFLVVTDSYTATYVDGEGQPVAGAMAVVSSGSSALNEDGQNVIGVGSQVNGILSSADFQVRDVLTINGADATIADFADAVNGDEWEVVVAKPYIQDGKYYTIQNMATNTYAYDNPSGTDDNPNLKAEAVTTGITGKHFFQIEAASAADGANITDGMFYIKSAQTGRYVKTPSQSTTTQALKTKTEMGARANFAHWITNGVLPGNTEAFGLVDAANVSNPTVPFTGNFAWNTNANVDNIIPYKNVEGDVFTPNSLWKIKRVPVINITFQAPDGTELTGITFTADGSLDALATQNKVLATVRNFNVEGYYVVGRQLKVGDAPFENYDADRDEFYAAVADLTEDAQAIITLRPHSADELDITIDLYSHRGEYWKDGAKLYDGNTTETTFTADEWRLTEAIEGVPADLDLKVTSVNPGKINARIHNYPYVTDATKWGIGFEFPTDATNNKFNISVSGDYYILQYEMSHRQYNSYNDFILLNEFGSTGTSEVAGNKVNITDTPCKSSTWFQISNYNQASGAQLTNPYTTACFFRVRIVNGEYLDHSKGYGRSICEKALNGGVGYPKKDQPQYNKLDLAIKAFDANDSRENYCKMLQAYSEYISCRVLQTGDDCSVYTISFIKPDGTKVLVNNGENGLEIVPYTEAARAEKSARWISHKNNANNKMVFVNKADGQYLQAKTNDATELGVSPLFDAATTAFEVGSIHQDLNDYMSSATDEKLLGAVYMKSAGRATTNKSKSCVMTISGAENNNGFATTDAPMYYSDYTSAISIEEVENGNTFNNINLNPAADGNYYASYYGFYPVQKPDGARLFYAYQVNGETGYLKLAEVQANVIRPYFPVIIISEGNNNLYGNGHEAHLHIGEYTSAVESEINGYIEGKTNILKGTFEEIRTDDMKAIEGGEIYVFSGNGDTSHTVGFFHYTGTWMPIGKAYYVDSTGSGIRGFVFEREDGEVSRIDLTEASYGAQDKVFDLSGRRVAKAQKGFYIVNGKKIIK